jgi:hypothetical protein
MEGGYTELERRFFREAAMDARVHSVYMLYDHSCPLSGPELTAFAKEL